MCVVQGPGGDFAADRTHRSTLAPDEVLAYLADRAKPTTREADVCARIAACDTNDDGMIDFGEVSRRKKIVALPQRRRERKWSRSTERA